MESTSLLSSPFLSCGPKNGLRHPKRASARVFATRKEAQDQNHCGGGGRLVDGGMIVLRKRMHEIKMMERNYEPPSDWIHCEKQIYTSYHSFICGTMGLLQIRLMNTRPSFALGILALLILSVPTSTALVLFHFMQITMDVLA